MVTSRLESKQHAILRILSDHAKRADVEEFIRSSSRYQDSGDQARADSVLQVIVSANRALYRQIRGEDSKMCQALRELMKEDIEEAEARGEAREKERNTLENIRNLMKNTNWSAKKAMDMIGIPAPLQAEYASKL